MLVLGIDPGTATTGFGLVRENQDGSLVSVAYGTIRTAAKTPMPDRLQQIHEELGQLLDRYQPAFAAVEKIFFQKNVKTAISVAQGRGVAILALAQRGLSIGEYTPNEIKQAIAGYGGADKLQVQHMVRALLQLDEIPRPDDAADALAVAICHIHSLKTQSLYQGTDLG
jgi:crossover junction endodeoxyribonuclease RuvC